MDKLLSLYHHEIPACLQDLSQTPEMLRLQDVGMNCGCEYTSFPRFRSLRPYSRFQHSMGAGLIVWHFTRDPAQAAAALLHDVATPVFAHVVDFLKGDHEKQEATEDATGAILSASPHIHACLRRLSLTVDDVADYHRYPIADNDTPRLSADRLEYTLGNLYNYGICSFAEIRSFYEDLTVSDNEEGCPELSFRTPEIAVSFTVRALETARIYIADEDRFSMQVLADLLRSALELGVLTEDDLHTTEPTVIQKLRSDCDCSRLWHRFCEYSRIDRAETRPQEGFWIRVPAKLRYIDPLTVGHGRVSQFDASAAAQLRTFRATRFDEWIGIL